MCEGKREREASERTEREREASVCERKRVREASERTGRERDSCCMFARQLFSPIPFASRLPTETKVESGTSQSKSGTSVNLSNNGEPLTTVFDWAVFSTVDILYHFL